MDLGGPRDDPRGLLTFVFSYDALAAHDPMKYYSLLTKGKIALLTHPGTEGAKIWEEWLGFPAMRMVNGRFPLSQKPGLGFELTEAALKKYPFGGTKPMARVFHKDGSVAEW